MENFYISFCGNVTYKNFKEMATVKAVPIERMLFGSDFPHAEGVPQPLQYLEEFEDFSSAEVEKVFCTNLKGLLEGKRD